MAAPEYVPRPATEKPRLYESPPWGEFDWSRDRPGDFLGRQPLGPRLGYPGPDQGYVLRLMRDFEGEVHLEPGERWVDVVAGITGVALKRASLLGRAPIKQDLLVAFAVWGFLNENPDPELVRTRRPLFEACSESHHYMQMRRVADLVPVSVLQMAPAQVLSVAATSGGWKQFFKRRGDSPAATQAAPAAADLAERARRAVEAAS